MTLTTREELLGRTVVADGRLRKLRESLNLTKAAMAELLHTTPQGYAKWEEFPGTNLWPSTAVRVGRFFTLASAELEYVRTELGQDMTNLMPLYMASTGLGIPQELLLKYYREHRFEAVDLGILGLWVHVDVFADLKSEAGH